MKSPFSLMPEKSTMSEKRSRLCARHAHRESAEYGIALAGQVVHQRGVHTEE